MANPTAVNDQVTDSITQVNTKVVGDSPAIAMGNLFQSTSQALSLAALNATNAQQQNSLTAQASTTMGVTTLYSIQTATDAVSTSDILSMMPASPQPPQPVAQQVYPSGPVQG